MNFDVKRFSNNLSWNKIRKFDRTRAKVDDALKSNRTTEPNGRSQLGLSFRKKKFHEPDEK